MSTMDAAFELPQAGPLSARTPVHEVRAAPGPWGFWGSLGWGLFAVATGLFATMVFAVIWMLTHHLRVIDPEEPIFANAAGIVLSVLPLAVLVIAVKIRRSSLRDYLAIGGFGRRDLALGIVGLAALILAFAAVESFFGIDAGSKSVEATYRAAKLAGALPLLWLSVVVVAPVTEELLFRGFLHRGWAPSWLGVVGTIVLTSALWAALHQQYNVIGILWIFAMGLLFGWLRLRSGSTTLTIVLHTVNNLFVTIVVTIQVEWMS